MPVAGKPIIAHIIDTLIAHGVEDLIFITGYLRGKIESFITANYSDYNVKFILQEPREGVGHAIWMAREEITPEEHVVLWLGDTILNLDFAALFSNENNVIGIKKVDNPLAFGVAEIDRSGMVKRVIEKPRIPKSNQAIVGIYKIANTQLLIKCLQIIVEQDLRTHNEIQLTDALMLMIEEGARFSTLTVDNWYDCGKKESLLEANSILLSQQRSQFNAAQYAGSIIIPPVKLGKGCNIAHSIIGPNVAIGDATNISHSIIQDSIIGSYSELNNTVLKASVIGNDTTLSGLTQSLNVGDNTEINFNNALQRD